jgi:biotin carboxyl carrier protein
MFRGRYPTKLRLWLIIGVLSARAAVLGGQDPRGSPDRTATDSARPGTLMSLDTRLRELERRLDAALEPRSVPPTGPPIQLLAGSVHKLRPRFACWIENVLVRSGQTVRQGELLAGIESMELADAKTDFLAKTQRFQYEQTLYTLHRESMKRGEIASALVKNYERDEATSRLEMVIARDQLLMYGLSAREIDAIKDEKEGQKAHFALRSPIDGVVLESVAAVGDPGGPGSVLFVIGAVAP